MRKFTLFFMSLFLAFGTAMAKDEVKDFNSPEVSPANGELATTVYNIRMRFPKEVVIAQSEVSIDVVNSKTNEVVKIVSCKGDDWDPYWAVFSFEQIEVDGKDGKEYRDQYIETPGTYTYTIPAGIVKSADGTEEFAGGTYSFSIVGTFEVADWSPKQATQVEDIVVTFDREITGVKLPASGLWIVDNYWSPVVKVSDAVVGDDKKSVTLVLESPITTPGTYNFDLYQGIFVSDDAVSQYKSGWFSVVDPTPSFSTNYQNGDKVKEFGDFVITFNNVKVVELLQTEFTVYVPGEGEVVGTAKCENNVITVTFDQKLTEEGDYLFYIPEGMFTMDGKENEAREISVNLFTFEITPLAIESVTPEVGTVTELSKIRIRFNQNVSLSFNEDWQQISYEIVLTCGEEQYYLTYAPETWNVTNELVYLVNAEWNGYEYASTPITAAGTYTLNLADIVVDHAGESVVDEGYPTTIWHSKNKSCEGTYTWTIEGEASIKATDAEAEEQVIYDMLGRRVERITGAGLYIVNGKKVVIK